MVQSLHERDDITTPCNTESAKRPHRQGGGEGQRRGTQGQGWTRAVKEGFTTCCKNEMRLRLSLWGQTPNEKRIIEFYTFRPSKTSKGTLFMPPSTHSSRDTVPLLSASIAVIMSFRTWWNHSWWLLSKQEAHFYYLKKGYSFLKQVMHGNLWILQV